MEASSPTPARITELENLISRLRHDIRGAVSPAMLVADRLRGSPDPGVQRAGERIIRTVERVLELLDATREAVPPRQASPKA